MEHSRSERFDLYNQNRVIFRSMFSVFRASQLYVFSFSPERWSHSFYTRTQSKSSDMTTKLRAKLRVRARKNKTIKHGLCSTAELTFSQLFIIHYQITQFIHIPQSLTMFFFFFLAQDEIQHASSYQLQSKLTIAFGFWFMQSWV